MNLGQILGVILITSGVLLTVALIVNGDTRNYAELSTFFSAYAGVCFSAGTITLLKTREKPSSTRPELGEIKVFSERN